MMRLQVCAAAASAALPIRPEQRQPEGQGLFQPNTRLAAQGSKAAQGKGGVVGTLVSVCDVCPQMEQELEKARLSRFVVNVCSLEQSLALLSLGWATSRLVARCIARPYNEALGSSE
jgi:hypothetical protein